MCLVVVIQFSTLPPGQRLERGQAERGTRAGPGALWFCRTVNKNRVDGENGRMCPFVF